MRLTTVLARAEEATRMPVLDADYRREYGGDLPQFRADADGFGTPLFFTRATLASLPAAACKKTPRIPDRMRLILQWPARTTPPSLRFGATVLTMTPEPLPPA